MNRRSILRGTAVATAVMLSLTACITGSDSGDEPETENTGDATGAAGEEPAELTGDLEVVSFYPEGSPDHERLTGLAEEFESRHPGVTVTLTFGGGQDTPQIEARWRAGDPPEVNYGFMDAAAPDGGPWVAGGQVMSLDDVMQEPLEGYDGTWEDAILPGVRPLISVGDEIYGAPESVTTLQFFYNAAIFEEQGIEPPQTFDDLVAAADTLKAAGIAPFTVTGTFLPYLQMYWDYLALRHIGLDGLQQAIAGETELATLPGAAEAAADLERLTTGGYFLDGFRGVDFTSAQMSFFQGDAAMILMGSWLIGEMAAAIPADFQVGTFPFPAVDGGSGDQEGLFGGTNAQVVAQDAENTDAAVAWLQFIAEPENQSAYVEGTGGISAYTGVAAPEGFEDVTAMLEEGAAFAPSYMGLLALSQEVQTAYQQPIAQLFFGEIDGAQMLTAMSDGLLAAAG
ncbi:ABC transporter substrate-binding protein [Jiangella mangrovi]|uniref:ABC-type glycerol-3-phosphate transport system substrate-binding protein n=1 Tax=Jiangella mangrovi TaxID=1524084 RepID=A0A7W9LPA5_9ACTN|nr:extracellular solute-binding protein [Jiangella mangrovi]MBB5791188.1 ABC-type glycerol-3-phosphate transport system substrate-binding protein [Jiangella mangrovi]